MAKILFLDDDRNVHEVVCTALEQHGYRVSHNWDSTISCVAQQAESEKRHDVRASFLLALMRAFAPWST